MLVTYAFVESHEVFFKDELFTFYQKYEAQEERERLQMEQLTM